MYQMKDSSVMGFPSVPQFVAHFYLHTTKLVNDIWGLILHVILDKPMVLISSPQVMV